MKKTFKVLTVILVVMMLITISTNVLADNMVNPGDITATYGDASELKTTAGKVMGAIRNVAVIASVIIIMILGVKYMLGSVEEKADYKKSFVPLIVGIVLVVAATSIATFIFNMVG